VTIVEPGVARTEFRYGSAQVAHLLSAYDDTPAYGFLAMLDPANGLAPGDPSRMAAAIIASAAQEPAPLRIVLGAQALKTTIGVLKDRVASFETQADLAASADFPLGELVVGVSCGDALHAGKSGWLAAGAGAAWCLSP
jgi:hypothetical protein